MFRFHTQSDSDVPVSTQLFSQISFAIACGHYPPGYRLPSTRQLAMQTGLHRNTISKVYRQLEDQGLVETRASSGIYVSSSETVKRSAIQDAKLAQQTEAYALVKRGLDQLLGAGCTLSQAKELFLQEIEWRMRCSARLLVSVPRSDLGSGQLMVEELQPALQLPIQLVLLEELDTVLQECFAGTVITIRYFTPQVDAVASRWSVRVIPVDIYNYEAEVNLVKTLPVNTCLGIVSISRAILEVAEILVSSMRGQELLVVTAEVTDTEQLKRVVRRADVIICDAPSQATVKTMIRAIRADLIRIPQVRCTEQYISQTSLIQLKRELGLETPETATTGS